MLTICCNKSPYSVQQAARKFDATKSSVIGLIGKDEVSRGQ